MYRYTLVSVSDNTLFLGNNTTPVFNDYSKPNTLHI
nr:MAG TPA: hypothetical protein [Caudoviricetes sp.]